MHLLALGILAAAVIGKAHAARMIDGSQSGQIHVQVPPRWPDAFEMEYTLSLPYVRATQPGGLKYPVHVWWDGPGQRYRFDVYGGMDSTGWDLQKGYTWNLYPRITRVTCDFTNGTSGPTTRQQLMDRLGLKAGESASPLPDISDWSYAGTVQVRNSEAFVWQFSVRNGEKTANYQFYTAPNGWPLMLYMMGRNLITGSHFDEYLIEFTRFKPGPVAASAFALPGPCKDAMRRQQQQLQPEQLNPSEAFGSGDMADMAARLGTLLPAARLGAGPASAVLDELRNAAESALEANARFVDEHNRAAAAAVSSTGATNNSWKSGASYNYSLSLNHFAHMTQEQFVASMLGFRRRPVKDSAASPVNGGPKDSVGSAAHGTYKRVLPDEQLPASVDWRGTGADGPGVKDQVSCGSCWAFSVVGALQGAWFVATGQSLSFSEQQLVDCAWDYGNDGCGGGYLEPTIQYVADAGGIAQEVDYPYLGQNGFCRGPIANRPSVQEQRQQEGAAALTLSSSSSAAAAAAAAATNQGSGSATVPVSARFSGYVNIPSRDEKALMEAVALHGPVAVLMDAALPAFRFYSEGVYHNENCGQDPDSMDHAILLVGYGTTPEGVDYWLIKNSWSKYWGMDGYARIARKGNDCGITTDPVLAVAHSSAVVEAKAAAATAAA